MESNNINTQIDNTFEEMKAEIAQEVGTILASKGVEIIEDGFDASSSVVKLMQKYNEGMNNIDQQIKHNNEIFKEDKARIENYHLHLDRDDLKRDTLAELDNIVAKQEYLHQQQVKNKQADPNYHQAKGEMLNVLSLLAKCDIPVDQLMDILSPSIEAEDTRTLRIAHTLLQSNKAASYAIESALRGIDDMRINNDLVQMTDTMKDYINTGNDGLSYFAYMKQYGGDK